MKTKFNVGLVVAQPAYLSDDPLSELKRFLKVKDVDILVYPEGYIHYPMRSV